MQAREVKYQLLEAEFQIQEDPEAPMKLAMLINDIDEAIYQATVEPAINLDDNEKNQSENEWCTHRERVARIEKHKGHTFSMVKGRCTQILMDKTNHDTDWDTTSTS